jgi:hypothetical protein
MTQVEQSPDYAAKVAAYLEKTQTRRLPWSAIVAGNHLTYTTTYVERTARQELAESAIKMLMELGVTMEELQEYDEKDTKCIQSKPSPATNEISSKESADPLPSSS